MTPAEQRLKTAIAAGVTDTDKMIKCFYKYGWLGETVVSDNIIKQTVEELCPYE